MRPRSAPSTGKSASIEFEGRLVSGTYAVWDGFITVTSEAGTKKAQVGATPPYILARILLRELEQDRKAQR